MIVSESLYSRAAAPWLGQYLGKIGMLTKIEHVADPERANYATFFIGTQEVLKVVDGFASGYRGEGPSTFHEFLIAIGIDPAVAASMTYNAYSNKKCGKREIKTIGYPNMDGETLQKVAKSLSLKDNVFDGVLDGTIKTYFIFTDKGNYRFAYVPALNEYKILTPKQVCYTLSALQVENGNLKAVYPEKLPKYLFEYLTKKIENGLIPYMKRKIKQRQDLELLRR